MSPVLRTVSAALAGGLVATAVTLGQPALADHDAKAGTQERRLQITSRQIKNHTIKGRDLSGGVRGLLGLAGTALQSIPANSITRDKMADNSVGSAEVLNNSLVAADLAQSAVGANEIAPGAVGPNQVKDGSLTSADVTTLHAVAQINVSATLAAGACISPAPSINTSKVLDNDLLLSTQPVDTRFEVTLRQAGAGSTSINFNTCNVSGSAVTAPVSITVPYAVIDN